MLQKIISLMLIIAFVNLISVSHVLAANDKKDAKTTAKVKDNIARLGTGGMARVKIELKDNRKIEGYVAEAGQDSFTVKNSETGQTTEVAYSQVKKARGNNLSTGAKIAIGVGVAIAVLAIVFLAAKKPCDDGGCF